MTGTTYQESSMLALERIADSRLGPARRNGSSGIMVKCPAHDDSKPSLGVSVEDGRLLVKCFAGCDQDDVINALRSMGLWFGGSGASSYQPKPRDSAAGRSKSRETAIQLWEKSKPAWDGHKYLVAKGVRSHGLRYSQGALLVPIRNIAGDLHGVQRIWASGDKRDYGDKAGNLYQIGDTQHDKTILIAEGYATAATLYEFTGHAAVVAFDCGNLLAVSEALRTAYPSHQLVVCADDDHTKPGNPGVSAATEAARSVGGLLAIPTFTAARAPSDSDFNDLRRLEGPEAVISCLDAAGRPHV